MNKAYLQTSLKYPFYINGKDLGMVGVDGTELPIMGKLNSSQVNAVLQQSKQKTEIVFKMHSMNGKFPMKE